MITSVKDSLYSGRVAREDCTGVLNQIDLSIGLNAELNGEIKLNFFLWVQDITDSRAYIFRAQRLENTTIKRLLRSV